MQTYTTPYNALLDASTMILLVPSIHPSILVLLNEWEGTTVHVANAHAPNDAKNRFFPGRLRAEEYANWMWDGKERKFVRARSDISTEKIRARSRLLAAKHDIVMRFTYHINIARYPVRSGLEFQEVVYLAKKNQAQRFKDSGYDENSVHQYPYVLQYADYAGISPRQAADDILLKASFDDSILAKTELLRLRYFNKIRGVRSESEIPPMYEAFMRECYKNALV